MSLSSFVLAQLYSLPPKLNEVRAKRGIAIAMDDGVRLMTDHYAPRAEGTHPTILMRLPYGRTGFSTVAEAYAERGFHVVLQACRGTEKSEGVFDPLVNEREDGLATLNWIYEQPWFDGRIGLSGPSYLGYAQWAICDALPERAAMATKVTSAEFESIVFPGGGFHLGLWLGWMQVIEGLKGNPLQMSGRMFSGQVERATAKAGLKVPLIDADVAVTGHKVAFWRDWLERAVDNPGFWSPLDHRHRIGAKTPPNHFISGWYDFMLDQLLSDYRATVDAGGKPYLTIGPWTHISNELQAESMRQTLVWMRAKLLDDPSGLRVKPVRFHIGGIDRWHEGDAFPPGPATEESYYLGAGRRLDLSPPAGASVERYRYDPADPTPNVGGAMFAFSGAGPVDNAPREKRADVVCFTSEPLASPLIVIGRPRLILHARAELLETDFFVRLCDVSPAGLSTNVTDGFLRVRPATERLEDGSWRLDIGMHTTAYGFRPGHRLRVQVSSGAYPRYARNFGTGEPVGEAKTLLVNRISLYAGPDTPSALVLPACQL
jgi:putative CocE/NonD family hydrolase